jgi:hypothetical protein
MAVRKFNHAGVDIYIPDDKKFEAILTIEGEETKVGAKDFDTIDEFVSWLERQVGDLKNQVRLAQACETRCKVAMRELKDAQDAVGKLKRDDFESDEEFSEASLRMAQRLNTAMLEKRGADDKHTMHERTAAGMKESLAVKEKKGK